MMANIRRALSPMWNAVCLMVAFAWSYIAATCYWLIGGFQHRPNPGIDDSFFEGYVDGFNVQKRIFDEKENPLYNEGYETGLNQYTANLQEYRNGK